MAGQWYVKCRNFRGLFQTTHGGGDGQRKSVCEEIRQQNKHVGIRHKSEVSLLPEARMHNSFLYSTDIVQCPHNKPPFFLTQLQAGFYCLKLWCMVSYFNSYLINACRNRNRHGTENLKKLICMNHLACNHILEKMGTL